MYYIHGSTQICTYASNHGYNIILRLHNWMLKTPLYWIAAFNFTCSQISLIYIQSMQHGMQNGAKCNLNAINLEINS